MIEVLRLVNFKCFEDQSLCFGPITLLSGLNGMGKSSILQALLLLRQSYSQGLLPAEGLALNGDLVRVGSNQDALFEGAKEDRIRFGVTWAGRTTAEWMFGSGRGADVLTLESPPVSERVYEQALFSDKFHYLQAERVGPRTFFEMSDYVVRQHEQLGTRGEYSAQFLLAFGSSRSICDPRLMHPNAMSPKLQDQVEAWMGEISPGTRIHYTPHAAMDVVNLEYSFVAGQQVSNSFRSTNVGFGITFVLPILVAILSSSPGTLILIENPEAHLHPRGQVEIGRLAARAASCGIQVVLETHSDHVLNGFRIAVYDGLLKPQDVCLHFLDRSASAETGSASVVSPQIDQDGRIAYAPDGFFDEWAKSLEALLKPREG